MHAETVQDWDIWFAATGMGEEWATVKAQFPTDEKCQLLWARIMEMNRISALTREQENK